MTLTLQQMNDTARAMLPQAQSVSVEAMPDGKHKLTANANGKTVWRPVDADNLALGCRIVARELGIGVAP